MNEKKVFISSDQAGELVKQYSGEYAAVKNPSYIFPRFEYYPLAAPVERVTNNLAGIVSDMDGTTTTTENLCLHSLETMVRRSTGCYDESDWQGLDPVEDYPHVIGNSTTRHVEYLIDTYGDRIDPVSFVRAGLEAALWTLLNSKDRSRKDAVSNTLTALGWADHLSADPVWQQLISAGSFDPPSAEDSLDRIAGSAYSSLCPQGHTGRVRLASDIYYYRYHEILSLLDSGHTKELSQELMNGNPLIEPMNGVDVFLCLVKGWLGEQAGDFYDYLADSMEDRTGLPNSQDGSQTLKKLGRLFADDPVPVGIVTSSIRYEAKIVLNEVFKVIRKNIQDWEGCSSLETKFSSIDSVYDAFVTASDSSEIRLKPHRDLYSIALHTLGISPEDFSRVAGFEDSESGTIAIRAAGIGLCVAVPFSDTAGHDFSAAAHVLPDGLPEVILKHNCFIEHI